MGEGDPRKKKKKKNGVRVLQNTKSMRGYKLR